MNWFLFTGVFLAYIIVDALNALYVIKIQHRQAFSAASIGAIMYFLLAVGVISYTQNYWYLVPIVLGSFTGTYLVVKYHSRIEAIADKSDPAEVKNKEDNIRLSAEHKKL